MKKIVYLLFVTMGTQAANLTIPTTFVANTTAVAAQVNGNFSAVETAVDDNDSRIATLEATITSLQSTINSLNSRLTTVENNTVLELDNYLMLSTFKGYPTAEFTAINLQVNNGFGGTSGILNGLGNIIIGYNESSVLSPLFCSNFQYRDSVQCIGNGFLWGSNVYRGSHNLVMGKGNSYDNFSSIVNGFNNVANGNYSSVLTGTQNIVNSNYSMISGGFENRTSVNDYASISGGRNGIASGHSSSISGGYLGVVSGSNSSISGGWNNYVLSVSGNISGGRGNTISSTGRYGSVSGGLDRIVTGENDWAAGSLFEDF